MKTLPTPSRRAGAELRESLPGPVDCVPPIYRLADVCVIKTSPVSQCLACTAREPVEMTVCRN